MPPMNGESHPFTKKNVDASPERPGVYELSQNGTVIYYGSSESSIRSRLQRHQNGTEGACTKAATTYRRVVTTAREARPLEKQLLDAFKRRNGKFPRCNEKSA